MSYAKEKLGLALTGTCQQRHRHLSAVFEKDFPGYLREDFRWLKDQLKKGILAPETKKMIRKLEQMVELPEGRL